MSRLVEFSDDEIKALEMLMGKLGFNTLQSVPAKPRKLSKTEEGLQRIREYRASKKRNN